MAEDWLKNVPDSAYAKIWHYFKGDTEKCNLWWKTKNPLFSVAPVELCDLGKGEMVERVINATLAENRP